MEEILEVFVEVMNRVFNMKIKEFIVKYRDLTPRHALVHEDEALEEVVRHVIEGKDYILVVDDQRRLKHVISYIDLLNYMGMKHERILSTALSSIYGSLRRSRIPSETFKKLRAATLSFPPPPHISSESRVEEALHIMESTDARYVVVVSDENIVEGVLTIHAIFRAIIRELRKRTGLTKSSQ